MAKKVSLNNIINSINEYKLDNWNILLIGNKIDISKFFISYIANNCAFKVKKNEENNVKINIIHNMFTFTKEIVSIQIIKDILAIHKYPWGFEIFGEYNLFMCLNNIWAFPYLSQISSNYRSGGWEGKEIVVDTLPNYDNIDQYYSVYENGFLYVDNKIDNWMDEKSTEKSTEKRKVKKVRNIGQRKMVDILLDE